MAADPKPDSDQEPPHAPDWLEESWRCAREAGMDQMSMEEIDAEIAAARREARAREEGAMESL